jgi:hypothetical protein
VKSVPLYEKIAHFQEDFCRKGTQRAQRQELMLFFLCDLLRSLAASSIWLRLCRSGKSVVKNPCHWVKPAILV